MNDELKEQIRADIELAKSMADINSSTEILDLTNRLIGYQDLMLSAMATREYEINQLKGKLSTLKEYMRTSKERYKELRELEMYKK